MIETNYTVTWYPTKVAALSFMNTRLKEQRIQSFCTITGYQIKSDLLTALLQVHINIPSEFLPQSYDRKARGTKTSTHACATTLDLQFEPTRKNETE